MQAILDAFVAFKTKALAIIHNLRVENIQLKEDLRKRDAILAEIQSANAELDTFQESGN